MNELDMLRNRMLRDMQSDSKVIIDFAKNEQTHNEGDIWTEDGKDWIFTDGIIKKLSQIGDALAVITIPNFCPKCGKRIVHEGDEKMYKIHNKCLKCVVEFETKLRIEGKWDEYVKQSVNDDIDWKINKLNNEMDDYFEFSKDRTVMDTDFNTELIENDIDEEIIRKNVAVKLDYLKKMKID